jgi:hypothetical protein
MGMPQKRGVPFSLSIWRPDLLAAVSSSERYTG